MLLGLTTIIWAIIIYTVCHCFLTLVTHSQKNFYKNLAQETWKSDLISCATFFFYKFLASNRTQFYFEQETCRHVSDVTNIRGLIGRLCLLWHFLAWTCIRIWHKELVQESCARNLCFGCVSSVLLLQKNNQINQYLHKMLIRLQCTWKESIKLEKRAHHQVHIQCTFLVWWTKKPGAQTHHLGRWLTPYNTALSITQWYMTHRSSSVYVRMPPKLISFVTCDCVIYADGSKSLCRQ